MDRFGDFLRRSAHTLLDHEEVVSLSRQMARGNRAMEALRSGAFPPEDRRRLVTAIQDGNSARERLILHNLRLVMSISSGYRVEGLTQEDLFQEGVLGLMRAVEKFDPDAGWRLSTYATWWIRQAIERAIADTARLIRLPQHVHHRLRNLVQARDSLLREKGRAYLDDLVDATGLQPSVVLELLQLAPGPASLDGLVGDGLATLSRLQVDGASPGPEEMALEAWVAADLRGLLGQLPERDAEVIILRFGIGREKPMTLDEVGDRYGLSRERIRQIQVGAMNQLRCLVGIRHEKPHPERETA